MARVVQVVLRRATELSVRRVLGAQLLRKALSGEGPDGALQISQVPWDRESSYRLPVSVWKEMMEMHHPNSAWLFLRRDSFEQLYNYKVRHGLPTWEQAIARALAADASAEIPEEVKA